MTSQAQSAQLAPPLRTCPGPWVKLYVSLFDEPFWTQLRPGVAKVAVYLLGKANYQNAQWYDGARMVPIPRGSFIASQDRIARENNLTRQQVREALKHLARLGFATTTATKKYTMITVCEYDAYQSRNALGNQQANQETTNKQPGDNQGATTAQNLQSPQKKQNPQSVSTRARVIDPELRAFATEIRNRFPAHRQGSTHSVEQAVQEQFGQLSRDHLPAEMERCRRDLSAYLCGKDVREGFCKNAANWLGVGTWQAATPSAGESLSDRDRKRLVASGALCRGCGTRPPCGRPGESYCDPCLERLAGIDTHASDVPKSGGEACSDKHAGSAPSADAVKFKAEFTQTMRQMAKEKSL